MPHETNTCIGLLFSQYVNSGNPSGFITTLGCDPPTCVGCAETLRGANTPPELHVLFRQEIVCANF